MLACLQQNDFAIEIVAGTTSCNSYIDLSTPGVDFNVHIIYDRNIKQLTITNSSIDIVSSSTVNLTIPRVSSTNASLTNLTSSNLNFNNAIITNSAFTNSSYSNFFAPKFLLRICINFRIYH
jgi:hypothetical protein